MQTTVGPHELALVSPQDFSVRMQKHWSGTLNMPSPPALIDVHRLVAEEFQRLILNNATGHGSSASVVLPLPTGSGKTQGTCLYASMQADLNVNPTENRKPVGIVIITRLIEDADSIAQQINEMSGRLVAVSHHSKNKADTVDMFNSDILVICHQAFLNAAKRWCMQDRDRWHRLSQWRGGDRLLFIIDEALANVVESNKATTDNLTTVIRSIPHELRQLHIGAVRTLEGMRNWLQTKEAGGVGVDPELLWGEGSPNVTNELLRLREALSNVTFDPSVFKDACFAGS